ncbi:MAG: hypothetical protein R3C45_05870 [Phycisphaerales bacterium]
MARSNKSTHFRLAGVQRLALSMNKAGERFWRAHPKLKRSMRDLYYRINGRPFEPADDPETIEALHTFYEPYNARLADSSADRVSRPARMAYAPAQGGPGMIAQLDGDYIRTRPSKAISRIVTHLLLQGRPLTTSMRWMNPLLMAQYGLVKRPADAA